MSRMLWSNISDIDWSTKPKDMPVKLYGSHSLKAWGFRLGENKAEYKGSWDYWNEEMHLYAARDALVTTKLFQKIQMKLYQMKQLNFHMTLQMFVGILRMPGGILI